METITFSQYKEKVVELYSHVCETLTKFGVPWWVHSGTLLGIKRNNGKMIPWDDDIDIMVPANSYSNKLNEIHDDLWSKKYKLIDWTFGNYKIRSDAWFAKVFYDKEYWIISDDGKRKSPTPKRPFIDIFYAVPADTFKNEKSWVKYERYVKLQWVVRPGFDRFLSAKNDKKKTFKMNLISYPMKLFISQKRILKYLWKPFNNVDGNWNLVRRADPWAKRNIVYNVLEGFQEESIEGKKAFINKDWENELIQSYGNNWKVPKRDIPHVYQNISLNWERGSEISKIIKSVYKNDKN